MIQNLIESHKNIIRVFFLISDFPAESLKVNNKKLAKKIT